MAAMTRLELARTELRTQALEPLCIHRRVCRLRELNPESSANRADVLPVTPRRRASKKLAPGEGFEPPLSDFRDRRVASYTIPEQSRANDRNRTCIDESQNLAPDPFGHVRHQMAGMER